MKVLSSALICRWGCSDHFTLRKVSNVIRNAFLTNALPLALTSYVVSRRYLLPMLLGKTLHHGIALPRQIIRCGGLTAT